MSCQRLPGGGIVCGVRQPPKCQVGGCSRTAAALCDHHLEAFSAAKHGRPRTCDMRVCKEHSERIGPDEDRCPFHASIRRHQQPRQGDLFRRPRPSEKV